MEHFLGVFSADSTDGARVEAVPRLAKKSTVATSRTPVPSTSTATIQSTLG